MWTKSVGRAPIGRSSRTSWRSSESDLGPRDAAELSSAIDRVRQRGWRTKRVNRTRTEQLVYNHHAVFLGPSDVEITDPLLDPGGGSSVVMSLDELAGLVEEWRA